MLNSSSVHLVLVHNIHTSWIRFRESINLSAFSRMTPGANTCESRSEKGRGGGGGGPLQKTKKKLKKNKIIFFFFFWGGAGPPPPPPLPFFFFLAPPPLPPWERPPPPTPHRTRTCELRVTPYLTMYVFVYLCRHTVALHTCLTRV